MKQLHVSLQQVAQVLYSPDDHANKLPDRNSFLQQLPLTNNSLTCFAASSSMTPKLALLPKRLSSTHGSRILSSTMAPRQSVSARNSSVGPKIASSIPLLFTLFRISPIYLPQTYQCSFFYSLLLNFFSPPRSICPYNSRAGWYHIFLPLNARHLLSPSFSRFLEADCVNELLYHTTTGWFNVCGLSLPPT